MIRTVFTATSIGSACILAALGRGVPYNRVVWRHALRLSLKPVVAIYGITIGADRVDSYASVG